MTRDRIEAVIDGRETVYVGSVDGEGFPTLKAMLAPRVREGLRVFYLTTNTSSMRVAQFRRDARAVLYFCDERAFVGVQLRGRMEVLEDAASRRLVWREGDEEYYPQGIDDPDYCVLRFTAHDGRAYADYASENFAIDPLTEGIAGDGSSMTAARVRRDGMLVDDFDRVIDRAVAESDARANENNQKETEPNNNRTNMRALISVSDKTGVVDFAKGLRELGWEVIATGGTMKLLRESGVEVINISDVTGFPEICDGRVKTLHPNVHGGLLARRDDPEHLKALRENRIEFIDLVCVNLYPFRQTIARPDVKMEDAIENIDIGGPSMLRSAAKNWADVTVVCDPSDYGQILSEIRAGGNTERPTRLKLSAKAYTHTAQYDAMIATYMRAQAGLDEKLFLEFDLVQSLRYGENPHQNAKFYREGAEVPYSLAFARQLGGKELSYNNIQDANAALCIVREFSEPFCVGLKHMNPCGAAVGTDVVDAWTKAYEADKVSIFGGIVATNRPVTREAAELMKPIFLEIIMAPKFEEGALEVLGAKKNLRLLEVDMTEGAVAPKQYVSVNGGLLVQDLDVATREVTAGMCVTAAKPSDEQLADLNFGWRIVKHVKSNAIVVVKNGRTLGVGAGQMNRIGSAEIALRQARAAGETEGLVLASDGFFPFDDCVTLAAEYGVAAIAQPGGSVRDEDSVKKADEKGIAMCFVGERHFKH